MTITNIPTIPWVGTNAYVMALGDSLMEQCRKDFGMGTRARGFIGWPGASSTDMRQRLTSTAEGWGFTTEVSNYEERRRFVEAGAWVLGLGTNDCWKGTTDAQWIDNIEWFMRQAAGRPVCWFDIKQSGDLVARAAQLGHFLYDATTRHGNLKIIPWGEWALENPSALLPDGVHVATYEYGCQLGRNRLIQHAVPDAPGVISDRGYWYPHSSVAGQSIVLTGWGASAGRRTDVIQVNLRVDWKHVGRWPVNETSDDVFAKAASGRGWRIGLGPEWRGKLAAVDLVDANGTFTSLGSRVL